MGKERIFIKMYDGCVRTLEDVRYVPELIHNLLSIGVLDKSGCIIKMLRIIKGAMTIMKGVLSNGLYTLMGNTVRDTIAATVGFDINKTLLLHMRLGHVSEKGFHELSKQGLLEGDHISKIEFYETCTLGKASRANFTHSTHKSSGILDYVHYDLGGPARVDSKGGSRYFMSIIDDHSSKVWVYFPKTKDQAFSSFKSWKTIFENQTFKKVKKLRTDNGLEFGAS